MARIRTIKPEFWSDDKVTSCSPLARLLFIGLWNFADDEGRMDDAPRQIKARVLPSDEATIQGVDALLGELAEAGLIERYGVAGRRYLRVRGWRHQKIDRRTASRIPPSPTEDVAIDADAATDGTPLSLSLPLQGGGNHAATPRLVGDGREADTSSPPPLRGRDRERGDGSEDSTNGSEGSSNAQRDIGEGSPPEGKGVERKGVEGSGVEAPAYADLPPGEQGALLIAVGDRVLEAAGIDPSRWKANGGGFGPVGKWLAQGCDVERDILPAIRAWAVASRKKGAVTALAYFDGVIADHRAARLAGMPATRPRDRTDAAPFSAEQNRRFSRYAAVLDAHGRRATEFRAATGIGLGDADDTAVAGFLGIDIERLATLLQGEKP